MTKKLASSTSLSSDAASKVYTLDDNHEDAENLARQIASLTWDIKALNTKVLDVRGIVSYTDYVVIATGTSDRQVSAIAKHVENELAGDGDQSNGSEGLESGGWALMDFGDVILHVFRSELREDYDLESMWPDAAQLEFDDKPEELYGHFELEKLEQ
jgi:ribosome-associated protein